MGLLRPVVELLLAEQRREPASGQALTLGVQEVEVTRRELLHELVRQRLTPPPARLEEVSRRPADECVAGDELCLLLGFASCDALDLLGGEGANLIHDLGTPIGPRLSGQFGLVLDGGTLEHVFEVGTGLRNVAGLVAPGGLAFHVSPLSGWENHGFYSLSPKLFGRAYSGSGFSPPRAFLVHVPRHATAGNAYIERLPSCEVSPVCDSLRYRTLLVVAARRERSAPFVEPVDTHQDGAQPLLAPRASRGGEAAPASQLVTIRPDEVRAEEGRCFTVELPGDQRAATLLEDGVPLSQADAMHADIRTQGAGRYSFWPTTRTTLFFSSSDGTDPRTGDRRYAWRPASRIPVRDDLLSWEQDEEFRRVYSAARLRCGDGPADRHWNLKELLCSLKRLDGDTAECGVFTGLGSSVICHYASRLPRDPGFRHRCFDSFTGLSAPGPEDRAQREDVRPWEQGWMSAPLNLVQENLAEWEFVSWHPGFIPVGFDGEAREARYAFVHLDVDLYQPTRDALEFFWPRMVPGGLIVCDDDGFLTCPGVARAMDELGAASGQRPVRLASGQAFLRKPG